MKMHLQNCGSIAQRRSGNLQRVSGLGGLVVSLLLLPVFVGPIAPAKAKQPTVIAQTPTSVTSRPVLRSGSKGAEVMEIQAALRLLGYYSGPVDGVYAESTVIAISQFQQAAGLKPDGITGPTTWTRLFPAAPEPQVPVGGTTTTPTTTAKPATSATATTTTAAKPNNATPARPTQAEFPILRLGMKGPAVAGLQDRLKAIGVYQGAADGVFGPGTQAAVKAAQRKYRLQPDGIVGPGTWRALLR